MKNRTKGLSDHRNVLLTVVLSCYTIALLASCDVEDSKKVESLYVFSITSKIEEIPMTFERGYDGYPMLFGLYPKYARKVDSLVKLYHNAHGKFPKSGEYFVTDLVPFIPGGVNGKGVWKAQNGEYTLSLPSPTIAKSHQVNGSTIYTVYNTGQNSTDDGATGDDVVMNIFIGW